MKAPVSWIREYVDLPADVTTEDLAARLTDLGLKLEAIERPGDDITGPLVVGRVLTMQPEPQSNGKTINWCTVDVGPELNAAHGTGEDARWASSAAPTTSPPATWSWPCCPAACCPARSRSPRARPTATCPPG